MKTLKMNLAARRFGKVFSVLALATIVSCVTVNVNFPESAVQRAADDFVRDLYKDGTAVADANAKDTANDADAMKGSIKKSTKKKPAKAPTSSESKPTSFEFSLFNSAYASRLSSEVQTNSEKAAKIKAKMADRVSALMEWKNKGVICETQDGMLKISNPAKAGESASKVKSLVDDENDDREELYDELKSFNKMASDAPLRKSFAGAFREKSPAQARCAE